MSPTREMYELRAVILTALPVERRAARQHLQNRRDEVHPRGTVYDIGEFIVGARRWGVLVAEIGAGNDTAACEAERAIGWFDPRVAIFLGIAGGVKDVSVGDVVAATKAYKYESGKETEAGLLPRPEICRSSYVLEQRCRAEATDDTWKCMIRPPAGMFASFKHDDYVEKATAVLGAIAAGEKVVASTGSATCQLIKKSYSDVIAVEMEGVGFLSACRANEDVLALVVRGISDLLDKKNTEDENWRQDIAARHASGFAFQVLAKYSDSIPFLKGPSSERPSGPPLIPQTGSFRLDLTRDGSASEDDRLLKALLASLGAFIFVPGAAPARLHLLERTVLAALVHMGGKAPVASLSTQIAHILGQGSVEMEAQELAVKKLLDAGLCRLEGDLVVVDNDVTKAVQGTLGRIDDGLRRVFETVSRQVGESIPLGPDRRRLLEQNVKRALLAVLRRVGPTDSPHAEIASEISVASLSTLLSMDLPRESGGVAALALASAVRDPANREFMATLARSYAALFLRNLDPQGKRWKRAQLVRSIFVLDTDAVLKLIVSDVPDHAPLLRAVRALVQAEVDVRVPSTVLKEVVTHVQRAEVVYEKFRKGLLQFPPEFVEQRVWNVVVKGFYYSTEATDFHDYRGRYWDRDDPEGYVLSLIRNRVACNVVEVGQLREEDAVAYQSLSRVVLDYEESRKTAPYREVEDMVERTDGDVRLALQVARFETDSSFSGAYLISSDYAFRLMERNGAWGSRPRITLSVHAFLRLTELVYGTELGDEEVVDLVFNRVFAAAAEASADLITPLVAVGVNLRRADLFKLGWTARKDLLVNIREYQAAITARGAEDEDSEEAVRVRRVSATLDLARNAGSLGLELQGPLAEVVSSFHGAQASLKDEREKVKRLTELVWEVAGNNGPIGKKTRKKITDMVKKAGGRGGPK